MNPNLIGIGNYPTRGCACGQTQSTAGDIGLGVMLGFAALLGLGLYLMVKA